MLQRETREDACIRAMRALYPRTHGPECADKYRAIAEWWVLSAETSMIPEEHIRCAYAQWAIATDMEARPLHHRIKPLEYTRYQWSLQK